MAIATRFALPLKRFAYRLILYSIVGAARGEARAAQKAAKQACMEAEERVPRLRTRGRRDRRFCL